MFSFQVRLNLKGLVYRLQGQKIDLDENSGTRSSGISVSNASERYESRQVHIFSISALTYTIMHSFFIYSQQ